MGPDRGVGVARHTDERLSVKTHGVWIYRFLIVVQGADGTFSAYSPGLPGCLATGKTRDQVRRSMHEHIEMHVRGLAEHKAPLPKPDAFAGYAAVLT